MGNLVASASRLDAVDSASGPRARWSTVTHEIGLRAGVTAQASPGAPAPTWFGGESKWLSSRTIQRALGTLWLLDGLLQLQPSMFGHGFIYNVNYNDVMGQPPALAHLLLAGLASVEPHLQIWNPLFAGIQLALGLGLWFRGTARAAIIGSIGWALVVWVYGEGLGGLFTGLATLVVGAPGAVLFYPMIGLIAWPVADLPGQSSRWRRAGGQTAERVARGGWAVLWVGGALLQLQPSYPSPAVLASNFSMNLMGPEPGLLVSLDTFLTRTAIQWGDPLVWGLALLEAAIGIAVLRRFHTQLFLGLGISLSILFWIGGQNFGGILTGQATDPGSGPLLVLLALALFPARGDAERSARSEPAAAAAGR